MKILRVLPGNRGMEEGFTLLEVMVSVIIISIALVTLIGSQSQSVSIAGLSRFETSAALLARQKMSEFAVAGPDGPGGGSGDFGEDFPGYSWQAEVRELGDGDTGIEGADGMLRLVELVISSTMDEDLTYTLRQVIMSPIEPEEKK